MYHYTYQHLIISGGDIGSACTSRTEGMAVTPYNAMSTIKNAAVQFTMRSKKVSAVSLEKDLDHSLR